MRIFPDKQNEDYNEIQEKIKLLTERKIQIEIDIQNLKESLEDFCPMCHSKNYEIKKRYEEGTYYDRSKTFEYRECNICGNRFKEECTYIGGYG